MCLNSILSLSCFPFKPFLLARFFLLSAQQTIQLQLGPSPCIGPLPFPTFLSLTGGPCPSSLSSNRSRNQRSPHPPWTPTPSQPPLCFLCAHTHPGLIRSGLYQPRRRTPSAPFIKTLAAQALRFRTSSHRHARACCAAVASPSPSTLPEGSHDDDKAALEFLRSPVLFPCWPCSPEPHAACRTPPLDFAPPPRDPPRQPPKLLRRFLRHFLALFPSKNRARRLVFEQLR